MLTSLNRWDDIMGQGALWAWTQVALSDTGWVLRGDTIRPGKDTRGYIWKRLMHGEEIWGWPVNGVEYFTIRVNRQNEKGQP